ncbi:acylphosphatase [Micropruina sp.]|uniref:acylphosphatase n=1 Tax=Micropruina sp. TaxID=2737536 RepID=UPI0039E61A0B
MERALIRVDGYVQGVGFRWWVQAVAREQGLVGYTLNLPDGRVEIDAQGSSVALGKLLAMLFEQPPRSGRPGRVTSHAVEWLEPATGVVGFRVR